jgi:hypothetical protein
VESNQRIFFEEYAASQNFSPLVAGDWYKTAQHSIVAKKVSISPVPQLLF